MKRYFSGLKIFSLTGRISLFIFLSIFLTRKNFGQDIGLVNYSTQQGLPSTEVYNVFQDSNGFIWFATDHGVVRFDGSEMKIFTVKDGLSDPVVFGFSEDENQRIWFRTYSGRISFYKSGKIYSIPWNDQLEEIFQNNIIYSIFSSRDTIYFSSEKYIGTISQDGKIVKEEIVEQEYYIKTISKNKIQYGFYGLSNRINKIKINQNIYPIELTDTVRHNKVSFVLQDRNRMLITINSDILEFDGSTLRKVFVGRGQIISLSKDNENFFWVGYSNKGVDRLRGEGFVNVLDTPILANKSITKVANDHEGGFWFTTLEEGVYYTPSLETQTINLPEKTRFAAFNKTHVVIADQKGFISLRNLTNKEVVWRKNLKASIRSVFIDSQDQLWVSTYETMIINLKDGFIKKVIPGSYTGFNESDSIIWAVGGLRVSQFDKSGESKFIVTNSIHTKILFQKPIIYTTGKTGLDLYDLDMNQINTSKILNNSKITSLTALENDLILLGTIGNGFSILKAKNLSTTSFNTAESFIANDVYHVQKIDSIIWLATEKGLIALNQRSLLNNRIQIQKTISQSPGFEKIKFFHIDSNFIWTLSDYQLKIIPNEPEKQKIQPIFYYEWIKPSMEFIRPDDPKIEAGVNDLLQLKFGFISFNNQNIYTRYRVSNSGEWIELFNKTINLQSISPGQHNFVLQYSIDRVNWLTPLNFPLVIHPPWWHTWYFRIALFLIAFAIGFIFYKRRIALYKERNSYLSLVNNQQKRLLNAEIEATERERSRIAKDLHDGISSDLISIKLITDRIAKKVAPEDVFEVETQVQKTISEIRSIIHGLNPPGLNLFGLATTIQNYLLVVKKNHSISITVDFQGEEVKDKRVSMVIFRVVQELTTNSIKHAHCSSINLHINVYVDMINISYSDDGLGFKPDTVARGFGLTNIESRVSSLGGQLNFESGKFGSSYSIDIPLANPK